jgi:hypothetical protein
VQLLAGLLAVSMTWPPAAATPQAGLENFVPVGVRYRPAEDAQARERDLREMQRLHFNVVSIPGSGEDSGGLSFINRLLARAPYTRVPAFEGDAPVFVANPRDAAETTLSAWAAVAGGARVIIFDDWAELQRSGDVLAAASAFAEAVTRNAPLYASLRPRTPKRATRDVRIAGGGNDVEATILESPVAFLVIGLNRGRVAHTATMTFSSDLPEAIWQNMTTGNTLSFVTRTNGPTYTYKFAPKEVLILMINKRLR